MLIPRYVLLASLLTAGGLSAAEQAARRDAQARPAPVGTAMVSGIVTSAASDAVPLRRVTVTAHAVGLPGVGGETVTGDDGRFVIGGLPAGRYTLAAAKAAFLPSAYGARPPTGPASMLGGTAVVLTDGANISNLTISLTRGAVITGVVRDPAGHPASGFPVTAHYFSRSPSTGERTLATHSSRTVTDDRGVYRIFGLHPGEYLIAATPGTSTYSDLQPTTDADVRWAQEALRRAGPNDVSGSDGIPPGEKPILGLVVTYHPGTPVADTATPIRVGRGEVRDGVDFQVQFVSTTRVIGTVTTADGQPATGTVVSAQRAVGGPQTPGGVGITDDDGQFVLRGLEPGLHIIAARRQVVAGAGGVIQVPPMITMTTVTSRGGQMRLDLTLRSGATLSGRVTIDVAEGEEPPDMGRVRVTLTTPVGEAPTALSTLGARPDAAGAFTISGVPAGRYTLAALVSSPSGQMDWTTDAASVNGVDALDQPIEVQADTRLDDAMVRLTNQGTELAGTMFDATGMPAPEYFIIVFSKDRAFWTARSRRIRQVRPASDGTYSVRLLPPGDYLLAAVTDVEAGQWFDPEFLQQLESVAIGIHLPDRQRVVQDIRVR